MLDSSGDESRHAHLSIALDALGDLGNLFKGKLRRNRPAKAATYFGGTEQGEQGRFVSYIFDEGSVDHFRSSIQQTNSATTLCVRSGMLE